MAWLQKRPQLGAALLLLFIVIVPYWRLATLQALLITDDGFTSDIANAEFPVRVEIGRLLRRGEWGMWSEQFFGGYDVSLHDPFTLLFFTLLPPLAAVNYCILAILFWAAWGTFRYTREVGYSWLAAVLAGGLFAHSGYMTCQLKHIGIIAAVSWIPWCLMAVRRLLYAETSAERLLASGYLALAFGAQVLAGFPQTAYFAALGYFVYALAQLIAKRKRVRFVQRTVAPVVFFGALAGALALAIGAVGLLPIWGLSRYGSRTTDASWEFATRFNFQPRSLFGFFFPYFNGDISNDTYRLSAIPWEEYVYTGVLCLLCAWVAMRLAFRANSNASEDPQHSELRALSWMGVFTFTVGLGALTPLYRILFLYLPGMSTFRIAQRFFCLMTFALVVLGARGWEIIAERLKSRVRGQHWAGFLAFLVLADPVWLNARQNGFAPAEQWLATPETARVVQQTPHALILSPGSTEMHQQAFRASPGWQSHRPYLELRNFLQPNINVQWNVAALGGYAGIAPEWSWWLAGPGSQLDLIWADALAGNTPMQFAVKATAGHGVDFVLLPEANSQLERLTLAHAERGPVHIYRIASAPDVYLAEHAFPAANDNGEVLRAMVAPTFIPGETVHLHADAATLRDEMHRVQRASREAAIAPSVRWLGRSESRHHVAVTTRGQWLVDVGTYTPDWQATIDGRTANVYRANLRQRAVFVPAGNHDVAFVYWPRYTYYGRALTLLGLMLTAILFWVARSMRRKEAQLVRRASQVSSDEPASNDRTLVS